MHELLAVYDCLKSSGATDCSVVTNIFVKTLVKRMFAKFVMALRAMNWVSHRAPAL